MKKILNKLFWLPIIGAVPLSGVISCSINNTNDNEKIQYESLKQQLDLFLKNNLSDSFGPSQIELKPEYSNNKAKKLNLFRILEDYEMLGNVFDFKLDPNIKVDNDDISIEYSFISTIDSYGNGPNLVVDKRRNSISIPALITMTNNVNNISVSKYINFITLDILEKVVDDNDTPYMGSPGMVIKYNETIFQIIPKIMVDKYLDLYLFSKSNNFIQKVRYDENNLEKWENKTLSEVYSSNNMILTPLNQVYGNNEYSYSITSYSFWQDDFNYARFNLKATLVNQGDSNILSDANKIYGMNFYKEYTYVDKRWKFATPSKQDISDFVAKNNDIASELVSNNSDSSYLYIPIVNISQIEANKIGVQGIVDRANKAKYFLPPRPFTYVVLGDDTRKVSFEIENYEAYNDDPDVLKINLKIIVGTGKLEGSNYFSKKFNIKSWKFV